MAPPEAYRLLIEGGRRAPAATDPAVFREVLRYYRVKPAYPALIATLPGNRARASLYVAWAAWLAIGALVWLWARPALGAAAGAAGTLVVMCAPFALELARLSTPDALSVFVVLAGLALIYQRGWYWRGMLVLLASLLVRPDNIFWVLPVAAWWAVRRRTGPVPSLLIAGVALAVVVALGKWSGNYGWATLFEHQFLHPQRALPDPAPALALADVARVYVRQAHPLFLPRYLLIFATLGAFLAWRVPAARELVALAAVSFVLRWLTFPSNDERLFVSCYFVILWAALRHGIPVRTGRPVARETPTPE
jgi:hypothetical protein